MPELPEVETIVRQLRGKIVGKRLKDVKVLDRKLSRMGSYDCLKGKESLGVSRRGKYIIFNFAGGLNVIIHLRIAGRLFWQGGSCTQSARRDRYTRAILKFEGGDLSLSDPRRFATMVLSKDGAPLQKLGVEPLTSSFNAEYLRMRLAKSRMVIKSFLIDQNKIAGIGNIYAAEILFASSIHPQRVSASLKAEEVERLVKNTKEILTSAIKWKGTSVSDYLDTSGKAGEFQAHLAVYRKEGSPCPVCREPIKRIEQGGRSTYFCESCQK